MTESRQLGVGMMYDRKEIHSLLGGDIQSYLPHVGGKVVCGCFSLDLNPEAPREILVGDSKNVVKYAKILAQQDEPIPVFLKRAVKRWEYMGVFRAVRYSEDPEEVLPKARSARSDRVIGVLFLEEAR